MAGDWIKMRGNLWDDPRVARLCDLTGQNEVSIIGSLYWLWNTADQHSEDGRLPAITTATIDRKTGITGIGQSLVDVGWIEEDKGGITIIRFSEHNGSSAKRRAMEAKRKGSVRKASALDADKMRNGCGGDAELEKELEKEKELKKKTPNGVSLPTKVAEVPLQSGTHTVEAEDMARYRQLYPDVDLEQEFRNMIGWLEANPAKRSKASKGAKQRIATWLARSQEKAKKSRPAITENDRFRGAL